MNKNMKILVVGNGYYYFYERAMCEALKKLGYENTTGFWYDEYLKCKELFKMRCMQSLMYKFQDKFSIGYGVERLNKELVQRCTNSKPDLVFLYRCRAVYPGTVKKIKNLGCVVFSYNNDNPFSDYYPRYFWRHYKKSIPYCDVTFVYRQSNIQECIEAGSKRTEILRSYYIGNRNFPIPEEKKMHDVPDVVFLGHYEEDERKEYLEALATRKIVVVLPSSWKDKICNTNIVFLEDTEKHYNEILNATKIALVFLSALNKDTYTRRCFEIPATKTMMLSIYTDDLAKMFEPDKEAVYFASKKELIEKTMFYLNNSDEREKIGQNGYARLVKDGHEVMDRANQIIKVYEEIINTKSS